MGPGGSDFSGIGGGGSGQPQQPEGGNGGGNSGQFNQRIQHAPISARVPERIARGVFSTGVIVIDGPYEFVLDFVMGLVQPRQVVARVVMSPVVVEQFVNAIRDNVGKYESRFGKIPEIPKPPTPPRQPTIQEIYDDLKINDETHAGAYANAVLMSHGTSEFTFDFITRFFPTAAVASRVFLAAPQVPKLLESLSSSLNRYRQRLDVARQQQQQEERPPEQGLG
jgi:hypothetical protein